MPLTRLAKSRALNAIKRLYHTRRAVKAAPRAVLNTHDPITLEKLPADGVVIDPNGPHGYDGAALFEYVLASDDAKWPLTRAEFTEDDLQRVSVANGRHPSYLGAWVSFRRWRRDQVSGTMSHCDVLWVYAQMVMALAEVEEEEEDAPTAVEVASTLVWPFILHHMRQLRPETAQCVAKALYRQVKTLPPGEFRDSNVVFFNSLRLLFGTPA